MPVIFIFLLILSGCASNSDVDEVKSPLNYLNGENYNTNPGDYNTPLYVPVPFPGARINKVTHITGHIYVKEGLVFSPLNNIRLVLIDKKDKEVLRVSSAAGGAFDFTGRIPNGTYRIEIESKGYSGSIGVDVKAYEVKGLKLVAKRQH